MLSGARVLSLRDRSRKGMQSVWRTERLEDGTAFWRAQVVTAWVPLRAGALAAPTGTTLQARTAPVTPSPVQKGKKGRTGSHRAALLGRGDVGNLREDGGDVAQVSSDSLRRLAAVVPAQAPETRVRNHVSAEHYERTKSVNSVEVSVEAHPICWAAWSLREAPWVAAVLEAASHTQHSTAMPWRHTPQSTASSRCTRPTRSAMDSDSDDPGRPGSFATEADASPVKSHLSPPRAT